MAEITLRVPLGRPLTYQEVDDNFKSVQELTLLAQQFALTAQEASTLADEAKNEAIAAKDEALTASGSAASDAQRAEDAADRAEAIAGFDGLHNTLAGRNEPGAHDASAIAFEQWAVGAVLRSVGGKLREWVSVADFMSDQDLIDISNGTQSLGVRQSVKRAVEAVNKTGGTLYFPEGHYKSPYLTHIDDANWIEITHSGVTLLAHSGTVILENFLIYVHGSCEKPMLVGDAGFSSGDAEVNTEDSHGFAVGDYIQLLSGYNVYTPDAGDWQLGSQNPTNLTTPNCRASEIHRVSDVINPNTVAIYGSVIYSDYRNTTTGYTHPIVGVGGAEIRRLNLVDNIRIVGICFKSTDVQSFRNIIIRYASNVKFIDCEFVTGKRPGSQLKTSDTLNLSFVNCNSFRFPVDASGSGWNSFIIGGGTQNVTFVGGVYAGEQQNIDFTPSLHPSDIGFSGADIKGEHLTTQNFNFIGVRFENCSDGLTTHPATYNLTLNGCVFNGGLTGARLRNKKSNITGNTFKTKAAGLAFSAFYDNTIVSNNIFEQEVSTRGWKGISFTPLSSEIMNNNQIEDLVVSGNTFIVTKSNPNNAAIEFRHAGNGVPNNSEFDLFTDRVKTNLSDYSITNNIFNGCSIVIHKWVNGVSMSGNHFSGGSDKTHYIVCSDDSARHKLGTNRFHDNLVPAIRTGNVNQPSYPYNTAHIISYQEGDVNPLTLELANSVGSRMNGLGKPILDSATLPHGGKLKAIRAGSGGAVLEVDAETADGTSNAEVRFFRENNTTGSKILNVYGRIVSERSDPRADNAFSLGFAASRWSSVFAATGTINTSDQREKQQQRDLTDVERTVAQQLKPLLKAFKWNDAVAKKGGKARWHFGVMAQEVAQVFADNGLDAHDYALFCYDEWEETPEVKEPVIDGDGNETGEFEVVQEYQSAGNRYGIRYDQLLAFMISAL